MIYDRLRTGLKTIFDTFGVPATVTRTVKGVRDKVQDKALPSTTTTSTGLGWFATRKVRAEDGVIVLEATAKLNVEVKVGDLVTIGGRSATVKSVEIKAPDGDTPMSWTAILG
ncbi:hypothetical protein ACXY7D_12065 [Sphingomonas melonis]